MICSYRFHFLFAVFTFKIIVIVKNKACDQGVQVYEYIAGKIGYEQSKPQKSKPLISRVTCAITYLRALTYKTECRHSRLLCTDILKTSILCLIYSWIFRYRIPNFDGKVNFLSFGYILFWLQFKLVDFASWLVFTVVILIVF